MRLFRRKPKTASTRTTSQQVVRDFIVLVKRCKADEAFVILETEGKRYHLFEGDKIEINHTVNFNT